VPLYRRGGVRAPHVRCGSLDLNSEAGIKRVARGVRLTRVLLLHLDWDTGRDEEREESVGKFLKSVRLKEAVGRRNA
jgi:hypothetical protein